MVQNSSGELGLFGASIRSSTSVPCSPNAAASVPNYRTPDFMSPGRNDCLNSARFLALRLTLLASPSVWNHRSGNWIFRDAWRPEGRGITQRGESLRGLVGTRSNRVHTSYRIVPILEPFPVSDISKNQERPTP